MKKSPVDFDLLIKSKEAELCALLNSVAVETDLLYNARNSKNTGKQIFFKVLTKEKERSTINSFLKEEYSSLGYNFLNLANGQKFGVRFVDEETGINILIDVKPNGKGSKKVDPNESMVACLLSVWDYNIPKNEFDMDDLLSELLLEKKNVVINDASCFDFYEQSYEELIQAISATEAIKKRIEKRQQKIYLTGRVYPEEIKDIMKVKHFMRDYNSSDLVLDMGNDKYIGISLKKAKNKNVIPTLLNKSINFLESTDSELSKIIAESTNKFFNELIEREGNSHLLPKKLEGTDWKRYINQITNEDVNSNLKGNSSHFEDIYKAFINKDETFIMSILDLAFKMNLKNLIDVDFSFYLATGIGDYGPKKGVKIKPGHCFELFQINTIMEKLLTESSFRIVPTVGLKQAFEEGATAAKLYFTICNSEIDIVNIEIRYKGNFTSNPQIFVRMTNDFIEKLEQHGKRYKRFNE